MHPILSSIGHMEHHSIIKEVVLLDLTLGHTAYFSLNA